MPKHLNDCKSFTMSFTSCSWFVTFNIRFFQISSHTRSNTICNASRGSTVQRLRASQVLPNQRELNPLPGPTWETSPQTRGGIDSRAWDVGRIWVRPLQGLVFKNAPHIKLQLLRPLSKGAALVYSVLQPTWSFQEVGLRLQSICSHSSLSRLSFWYLWSVQSNKNIQKW